MTNDNDSSHPSYNPEQHSEAKPELPAPAPQQSEVGKQGNNSASENQTAAQEMRREFRWFEFSSLFVQVALVIIGVCALRVYNGQLTAMKGQLTEMQEARKQAKVDNANAIAAQQAIAQQGLTASQQSSDKSFAATVANFQLDQRAWIGALGPRTPDFSHNEPYFSVIIGNSGKTPGRIFIANSTGTALPKGQPFEPHYMQPDETGIKVLQPGSPGTRIAAEGARPKRFSDTEINALKLGTSIFYLYGKLTYKDIFEHVHHTTYCYLLNTDLTNWDACDTYNDAD